MELHDDSVVKLSPNYKSIWDSLPNNYKTDADTKDIIDYLSKKKSASIEEISKRVFYTSDTYRYKLVTNALIRAKLLTPVAQRISNKILSSKDISRISPILKANDISEKDILNFINAIASGDISKISDDARASVYKLINKNPPKQQNEPQPEPQTTKQSQSINYDNFINGLGDIGYEYDDTILMSAFDRIRKGQAIDLTPNEIKSIKSLSSALDKL